MAKVSLSPIAFFRADDRVAFWLDTPRGWELFNEAARAPRALLAASVAVAELSTSIEAVCASQLARLPGGDYLVVPFDKTNLPLSYPNMALAGVHPSLLTSEVPTWDGPTTRADEMAVPEGL